MTATTRRAFRATDDEWEPAMRRAALEHRTLSEVLRITLRAYGEGRYDAVEPKRTEKGTRT
jgi:hypothetical protein